MISALELAFFFVLSSVMVLTLWYEDKQMAKTKKSRSSGDFSVSKTHFHPHICWFRDYWSNRSKLGRNKKKTEGIGWTKRGEFNIDLLGPKELQLERNKDNQLCLRDNDGNDIFTDVVDPTELIKKIEPQNIEIAEIVPTVNLPFLGYNRSGTSLRGMDRLEQRVLSSSAERYPPEYVYVQPITQMKGKLPLGWTLVCIFAIWATSLILRFFLGFFPQAYEVIYPIQMVGGILIVVIIIAWKFLSEATKNLKQANAYVQFYDGKNPTDYHYNSANDIPGWLESKLYWVFCYIYVWKGELTLKKSLPFIYFKKDLERIEVWIDAKKGNMEWIVCDYHYRELWYRAASDQSMINVFVLPNFHTIVPVNITIKEDWDIEPLFDCRTRLFRVWEDHKQVRQTAHYFKWINSEMGETFSGQNLLGESLAVLWWDYWRYPLGGNNKRYYCNKELRATGMQPYDYIFDQGSAFYNSSNFKQAIRCFEIASKLNQRDQSAWYNLAFVSYRSGDFSEAIRCYNEVLKLNPRDQIAWLNLGKAFFEKDGYDDAIKCCEKALGIDQKIGEAWYYLALAHGKLGNLRNEKKYAEKAKALGFVT